MLPTRGVAPVEHRLALVGPVRFQPLERAVDQRIRLPVTSPVVVPALVADLLAQRGGAVLRPREEREIGVGGRDLVQFLQHLERLGLHRRTRLGRRVGDPAAEHVRRDVGRRLPVDAAHHEELRIEPLLVELDPAHLGRGHVGTGADEPHALGLELDVVLGKDRIDVLHRREPRGVALVLAVERHLEQHRLARHPVAGRRRVRHDGINTERGPGPLLHLRPDLAEVASPRSVERHRLFFFRRHAYILSEEPWLSEHCGCQRSRRCQRRSSERGDG